MDIVSILILFAPAIPTAVCTAVLSKQQSDWFSPERYWATASVSCRHDDFAGGIANCGRA
jgi:hypothetical protein